MGGKIFRSREVCPSRGDGRYVGATAESQGGLHRWTRRQLGIQILPGFSGPYGEGGLMIGQYDQAASIAGDSRDKVKGGIAVAVGQQTAEVGVALRCFSQEHRTMVVGR